MQYRAIIEQHRRDYSGVLRKPVRSQIFDSVLEAKIYVETFFRTTDQPEYRFGVVEAVDGSFSATTPTDGPLDDDDWEGDDFSEQSQRDADARLERRRDEFARAAGRAIARRGY